MSYMKLTANIHSLNESVDIDYSYENFLRDMVMLENSLYTEINNHAQVINESAVTLITSGISDINPIEEKDKLTTNMNKITETIIDSVKNEVISISNKVMSKLSYIKIPENDMSTISNIILTNNKSDDSAYTKYIDIPYINVPLSAITEIDNAKSLNDIHNTDSCKSLSIEEFNEAKNMLIRNYNFICNDIKSIINILLTYADSLNCDKYNTDDEISNLIKSSISTIKMYRKSLHEDFLYLNSIIGLLLIFKGECSK